MSRQTASHKNTTDRKSLMPRKKSRLWAVKDEDGYVLLIVSEARPKRERDIFGDLHWEFDKAVCAYVFNRIAPPGLKLSRTKPVELELRIKKPAPARKGEGK